MAASASRLGKQREQAPALQICNVGARLLAEPLDEVELFDKFRVDGGKKIADRDDRRSTASAKGQQIGIARYEVVSAGCFGASQENVVRRVATVNRWWMFDENDLKGRAKVVQELIGRRSKHLQARNELGSPQDEIELMP